MEKEKRAMEAAQLEQTEFVRILQVWSPHFGNDRQGAARS